MELIGLGDVNIFNFMLELTHFTHTVVENWWKQDKEFQ